jgi:hypothetical protein
MLIKFSPSRADGGDIVIAVRGDVLTVGNEEFDFSNLRSGDLLPSNACTPASFFGDIVRGEYGIELTVVLPHGANAPYERRFPEPIITVVDGPVELPPYDIVPEPPVLPENQEGEGVDGQSGEIAEEQGGEHGGH